MSREILVLLICAALATLSGCASIVTGTQQEVTFNSEPDGATVIVSGKTLGKTPITVNIKKEKGQTLTFEKDGYKPFTTPLTTHLEGWFWGNIILGGLIGSTIDGVSGGMHEYEPGQYFVTLTSEKPYGVSEVSSANRIRELLVGFGDDFRSQLSAGQGELLDQVVMLINPDTTPESKARTVAALKKLTEQTSDNFELAKKVIDFYSLK